MMMNPKQYTTDQSTTDQQVLLERSASSKLLTRQAIGVRCLALLPIIILITAAGCSQPTPEVFRSNAVYWLTQERLFLEPGEQFASGNKADIGNLLTAIFGTAANPRVPSFVGGKAGVSEEVLSLENVQSGGVLYREHCARCHGLTGDGAGIHAASLNPYPRDYRMGIFKWKSTPMRSVPTDADLRRVVEQGVAGTEMPPFGSLSESEIAAVIQYVKYLTIRGQFERSLISEVSGLSPGDRLLQTDLSPEESDDTLRELVEQLLVDDAMGRWQESGLGLAQSTKVPERPASLDRDDVDYRDRVAAGRRLYYGKGNCFECHGDSGLGNGQTNMFDDWTSDWIRTPGVEPFNAKTWQPFLRAGALPPRTSRPRNLTTPVYRGGSESADLYRRIANGIEGTPMPPATTLQPDEIWSLVAFIEALPYESPVQRTRPAAVE